MKQQCLPFLNGAKKGFIAGTLTSFVIYGCIRLLFYGFDFSAMEEISLFLKTIGTGGSIVSIATVLFLLLERIFLHIGLADISFPSFHFKKVIQKDMTGFSAVPDI